VLFSSHRKHIRASTACYGDSSSLVYVDDVYITQETHSPPDPVTGISLVFLYVDGVRTSQEKHPPACISCYLDRFTSLYVDDGRTTQETYTDLNSLLEGELYFSYVDDVRTSLETHTGLYGILQ
jgi:hypothetical protein